MKTFEGYKEVQNLFTHQWDPQDLSCLNHNTPTSCSHRMVLKGFGYYITNLGGGEKNKRGIRLSWQVVLCPTSKYMIQQAIVDWVHLPLYIYPSLQGHFSLTDPSREVTKCNIFGLHQSFDTVSHRILLYCPAHS